ncbi:hypothetical protein M9458_015087 [Cirrhinus mrigala]|uniref:RNase H type-1 domain-containing protein n=1 Tax=Cirrhinus mrigala TaxID=683832 RepID=A0ABD0QP18_CIRMR
MSLSKLAAASGDGSSCACPATCGALIAAKDLHPFCVVCLGLKHAEEALQNPENCSHCLRLAKKLLRSRLKVAATQCVELSLSDSDGGHSEDDTPQEASWGATSLDWADQPNPAFPEDNIFGGNLPFANEPASSGNDDDAGLLGVSVDEEAILPSYVRQANAPVALPQSILLDSTTDQERDVYDGKQLGPPPGPRKQLFPHIRHYWSDPLNLKHGLVGLEVKDMAVLGMGDPPAIKPSIARHLSPVQGRLLAPLKPAELLDDLGQQLDKGSPSPTLWKEILTVNNLVLRNARQAVQACGPQLWLNLSGLPDSEKRRIAGAPVEPGQALFGPTVALMQQRCDDKKKEDEAFKLCLPRKAAPRQVPPARLPNPPTTGRRDFQQSKDRPHKRPPPRQSNPPSAKAWGRPAPATAAAGKVTEGGNDRRILNRMGSHSGGQSSERCVDKHTLGHHVLVRCDNTTAVAHINRQGWMRSFKLHALAHKLLVWSRRHFLSLRVTHVPGILNRGADVLSRGNPLYGEWRLHPQIVDLLWERFSRAAVDLFASRKNTNCPMFFSLRDNNAPLGVDALAHPWPNVLLYAFPPLCLISPTLARVKEQSLTLILIAPRWPKSPWLAEIVPLLYAQPWPLPLRTDLLSQADGEIHHPHPDRLRK